MKVAYSLAGFDVDQASYFGVKVLVFAEPECMHFLTTANLSFDQNCCPF